MEATHRARVADPEFDRSPSQPLRLQEINPPEHQRLVVNPFLAVFLLIVLGQFVGWLSLLGLPFFPQIVQYHCLDCGKTGRYSRGQEHACSAVLDRWRDGRRAWFPASWVQFMVWCWVLGAVGILLFVVLTFD